MISLLLKDVVKSEKLALQSSSSLHEVIDLMNANKKGVVALLEGKKPVGILTERDFVKILHINRLKNAVEGINIPTPKGDIIKITSSFGVSTYPDDGLTSEDLLIKTDERLYQAKNRGKNQVVCID